MIHAVKYLLHLHWSFKEILSNDSYNVILWSVKRCPTCTENVEQTIPKWGLGERMNFKLMNGQMSVSKLTQTKKT